MGCSGYNGQVCPYTQEIQQGQQQAAKDPYANDEAVTIVSNLSGGWKGYKKGRAFNFEQKVTLAGTSQTVELPLDFACRIDRITQYFNSTNSRTFNIRVFTSRVDTAAYEELDKKSGHATQSRQFTPIHPESNKYLTPRKIQFNYSSYTAADTITILVQVTKI